MRFILMLRSTFELLQEPMRFILMLRSTFELPWFNEASMEGQKSIRYLVYLNLSFEDEQKS